MLLSPGHVLSSDHVNPLGPSLPYRLAVDDKLPPSFSQLDLRCFWSRQAKMHRSVLQIDLAGTHRRLIGGRTRVLGQSWAERKSVIRGSDPRGPDDGGRATHAERKVSESIVIFDEHIYGRNRKTRTLVCAFLVAAVVPSFTMMKEMPPCQHRLSRGTRRGFDRLLIPPDAAPNC
jgi:hypothetical protein